jgi:hypothetical protein
MGNVFSCCLPEVAEGEIVYVERHQMPSAPPASPPPPTPPPAYDDILADIEEDMEEAMVDIREDLEIEVVGDVRVVRRFVAPPPTPPPAYEDILADVVEDMEEAMQEEDRTVRVVREFVEAQRDLCDAHDALLRSIAASLENVL